MKREPQPRMGTARLARALVVMAGALLGAGCTDSVPQPRASAESDNPYPAGAETPTFFSGAQWKPFERDGAAARP